MKPSITRELAKAIATEFLQRAVPVGQGLSVESVYEAAEITSQQPSTGYGGPTIPWDDVWVAYCSMSEAVMLKSSDIIVVSKETGQVLYFGSAHDEG